MKDINKDLRQDAINLKFYKTKFFLIGFIIGIIPYIILITIYNNSNPITNLVHFKEIITTIGISTAFINAFILQSKVNKRCTDILQINKGVKINS